MAMGKPHHCFKEFQQVGVENHDYPNNKFFNFPIISYYVMLCKGKADGSHYFLSLSLMSNEHSISFLLPNIHWYRISFSHSIMTKEIGGNRKETQKVHVAF